ncbi:MAG: hypothetical protein H6709_23955 [Kofleriaceae bacterium]|nr:hypothetical protein [Kofleriaceae bacterium]MCB9575142.1 hypothetical protein [Kofleriaceae bacterium]
MTDWQWWADGIGAVEHAIDPALAEPVANTPTGPGRGAPSIAGTEDGVLGHAGQLLADLGRGLGQEGWLGLLDPVGLLDRQQAQRELRGNFEIIDPAHPPAPGTAAPNRSPRKSSSAPPGCTRTSGWIAPTCTSGSAR